MQGAPPIMLRNHLRVRVIVNVFKFCVFAKNVDAHGEMLEPWFEEKKVVAFYLRKYSRNNPKKGVQSLTQLLHLQCHTLESEIN